MVLCAVGDLVEDVVGWLSALPRPATDTPERIFRRRGGSAAIVAGFAASVAGAARFIGRTGTCVALAAGARAQGVPVSVDASSVAVLEGFGLDRFRAVIVDVAPVAPAGVVADTTGAGDAFAAGFLVAWSAGKAVVDAVRAGTALAVTMLAGPGAGP
jgi:sugar/nucleoside kinase (ribokinase family)